MPETLQGWLDWMAEIHPAEMELGLDRVYSVARALSIAPLDLGGAVKPTESTRGRLAKHIVIVAGTNGKGSTIAALQQLVQQAGLSSFSYTSPHFEAYSERFVINGQAVADSELCRIFEKIEVAREAVPLTFFEYSTLAALLLCMELQPAVAILEVGLGGRLDAINTVPADIAVISQIALDHQDWLGNTRELIGAEKAGILRKGCKFVCADRQATHSITRYAKKLDVRAHYLGKDFELQHSSSGFQWQSDVGDATCASSTEPSLHRNSMAAALKVFEMIRARPAKSDDLAVLEHLSLTGRQQQLQLGSASVLLDVAHNPAAVAHLKSSLLDRRNRQDGESNSVGQSAEQESKAQGLVAVFAVMGDKAWREMLDLISDVIDAWFLAELPGNQRAESTEAIAAYLLQQSPSTAAVVSGSVAQAMELALARVGRHDQLVVFGSFFTVAAALKYAKSVGERNG